MGTACLPAPFHHMESVPSAAIESADAERERWLAEHVRLHEPALRGYLRSRFPSLDADDVVQESYLKLLRVRAVDQITAAKAYFFSVARNTALTIFRRHKLYADIPVNQLPDSRVLDSGPDAAEIVDSRQRIELAVEAIDRLPARCREIMKLAVLQGLSTAEVAGHLGLAESTVRVQLARGVKKCAHYLREQKDRR